MTNSTPTCADAMLSVMARLRHTQQRAGHPSVCDELSELLSEYFDSDQQISLLPHDQAWLEFRKRVQRTQNLANILQDRIGELKACARNYLQAG